MGRRMVAALVTIAMVSSVILAITASHRTGAAAGHATGLAAGTMVAAAAAVGISAEYRVTATCPPDPSVSVEATFTGIRGPVRFVVGFPMYPNHSLELFKDLRLTDGGGKPLSFVQVDQRTIEVSSGTGSVVVRYSMDLGRTSSRGCKVDFDRTVTYGDGFPIRVVGFRNFAYEHWNAYRDTTPLEEASRRQTSTTSPMCT